MFLFEIISFIDNNNFSNSSIDLSSKFIVGVVTNKSLNTNLYCCIFAITLVYK